MILPVGNDLRVVPLCDTGNGTQAVPYIWWYCNTEKRGMQLAGTIHESPAHPVGKSYASKVDDEKSTFEQRSKHRQNRYKNPATSIVAAIADMGG